LQRIDVEAGIGLVEQRELRLEHGHLQDLVALLLAAREAFVDAAIEEALVHLHELHLLADQLQELEGVEFGLAVLLAQALSAAFSR
jgi:hypothetical protein